MLVLDDTIAAIATANRPAQRGIIRVSGPKLIDAIHGVAGLDREALVSVRQPTAMPCEFLLDEHRRTVNGSLYFWPGNRSYTRQPMAELHLVGCPPLLELLLDALCQCGARLARPGEFTLRAFLGGRLDLTEAEAVLGAIDAGNEREFKSALSQMAGGLSGRVNRLREALLELCADLEAGLDFVDEDIEFVSNDQLQSRLGQVHGDVQQLLSQLSNRQLQNDLPRVLICGAPNAGKSTLFNALLGEQKALTSQVAGTTRDFLSGVLYFHDIAAELVDTAGIDVTAVSPIDAIAQQRTQELVESADLIVGCLDLTHPRSAGDQKLASQAAAQSHLVVATKADRDPAGTHSASGEPMIKVSAITGQGIGELRAAIAKQLAKWAPTDVVSSTAARSRESLRLTLESLGRAVQLAGVGEHDELIAAELRNALDSLGMIVGAIYTDDLLDKVFSRFCIGK